LGRGRGRRRRRRRRVEQLYFEMRKGPVKYTLPLRHRTHTPVQARIDNACILLLIGHATRPYRLV